MDVRRELLAFCLIYVTLCVTHAYGDRAEEEEAAYKILEKMADTRRGLGALRQVIEGIDDDLLQTEKRNCALGGGMTHHCATALLDKQLNMKDWLRSGQSPGKRSVSPAQSAPQPDDGDGDSLPADDELGEETARALRSINVDNTLDRKRWGAACNVGAGMSGYQCHLASLRSDNKAQEWLSSSPLSPGKRSGGDSDSETAPASKSNVEGRIRDIQTKRKGLQVLKKILQEMDADLLFEQKRTCNVNLGGHCSTESAASVADQWHYLNSPLSPGRKRRDTRLYRKLISGKLLA